MNKRKLAQEDDDDLELEALDQPRKLPAIGTCTSARPLVVSRTALNRPTTTTLTSKPPSRPQSRTASRDPPLAGGYTRTTRATSAPPKPSSSTRPPIARVPSGSLTNGMISREMDAERAKLSQLTANHLALSRELASAKEIELDKRRALVDAADELDRMRIKHQREIVDLELEVARRGREARDRVEELKHVQEDLTSAREIVAKLKLEVTQHANRQVTLHAQIDALQVEKTALQRHLDEVSSASSKSVLEYADARRKIEQLEKEAREAEMVRRKLHNMVQELKGNIRVFCRVRPVLPHDFVTPVVPGLRRSGSSTDGNEERGAVADISFPDEMDHREIIISSTSSSATGQERKELHSFTFDRVFEPEVTQREVFEEISLLAQSCVDGYNVCIFAYGQTGSGKSFTMEGGSTEATMGMIPRAVNEVFRAAETLRDKGWEYKLEGQFLEIYNETINDLLGKGEFDKKKHDIKHEKLHGSIPSTRVTDITVHPLSTPHQVTTLLQLANSRRTVAATLMNSRSSRSHSVFTLRVSGYNEQTGTRCEGCLNLVDLAGSERLSASGAAGDKERLKETQSINKSLSALGDVIAALGESSRGEKESRGAGGAGEKHVPYRNSKLTYLLQNSLSGNSKTLMILNLSPLAAHLGESLTSLRFATKVNNTTIGTAKKQLRGSG